ncbi:MAG TPA: PH domain-containing protein [Thermoanaerobaculia bacterium]|nr:PH domain-containing protein [Thermoanaerobaculia bacterium]
MSWRASVLRLLRVPHDPEPPPGSAPRLFRAAPNFFKLRLLRWAATRLFALTGLLFALYFVEYLDNKGTPRMVVVLMQLGEIFGWIAFAVEAFLGWCIVRLDYELRWYMVNDRAIRIREGILNIREKTIALANVQNIGIKQGPLQRALGIADVEVKTAGGGGSSSDSDGKKGGREPMHVAYFRGVDNAEEIRDLVREGVRMQKNAGLGDPDEVEESDVVAELLAEARALRVSARALS